LFSSLRSKPRLLFAGICAAAVSLANAAPGPAPNPPPVTFEIAAAPAWVTPIKANHAATDADEGGISYLVVDRQENIADQSSFYHEVRRVTSETGVQNGASVTATFDPSYEKLIFHDLHIIRGSTRLNRLVRGAIKLLQRERDMESFLYDGAYTARCDLEDVRVGDVIEYAYTVQGMNPVKAGRYSRSFFTDGSTRIDRIITRFIYPANRPLHFQINNRPLKPSITTEKGTTSWLSDQSNVPGRRTDRDVPLDYEPNGWVQVSEFGSWQEVVDWALPLFTVTRPLSAELNSEIEKLRGISDVEKRILAALRLVQDQVRYLGIESGVGSHRPTAPTEVFRRRFGDCKDKALLLATLLQHSGVDAVPALVSTNYRKTVKDRLPAPDDFDHAIVQVRNGIDVHWLDPTRSSQRGRLSEIYVRDLGFALVLRRGADALTSYSPPLGSSPRRIVTENYIVPEPGKTGELEVVTEAHGLSAERTRSAFQEEGREKLEKEYLQYYTRLFPKAEVKKPLAYEEIEGENACRVREFYRLPDIWTLNEETHQYELFLHPGDVAEAMGKAGPSQRDDPLALNYPANVTQIINAKMFDRWSITAKNQKNASPFFSFSDEARVDGRDVKLQYEYIATVDRVLPKDLPQYNASLTKIRDSLGYTLYYQKPDTEFPDFSEWLKNFNWVLGGVTLAAGYLLLAAGAGCFFGTRRRVPLPPPAGALPRHSGLRGWLVLVALNHLAQPLVFIVALVHLCPMLFNLGSWHSFVRPSGANYHPYWGPILLAEFFGNLVCLAASILLLFLFFRKRAVWPRTYAAFLLFVTALVFADFLFAQKIPAAREFAHESTRHVIRAIVSAVIWIPYCFLSKRVRATFRR
jgi:transglutaminase-like putative cysteine protease